MLNAFTPGSVPSAGLHGKLKAFKSEDIKVQSDKDAAQLEYERSLLEHQLKLARRQIEQLQAQLADARVAGGAGDDHVHSFPSCLPSGILDPHLSTPQNSGTHLVTHTSATSNLASPRHQSGTGMLRSVGSFTNASAFVQMQSAAPGGTYLGVGPGGLTPTSSVISITPSLRSPPSIHNFSGPTLPLRQSYPPPTRHIPALHSHFNYGIPQPGEDLVVSEPADDLHERSEIDALDVYASELGLDSVTEVGQVEMLQAEVDRLNGKLHLEDAAKVDLQRRVRELEDENSGLRRQVETLKKIVKEGQSS